MTQDELNREQQGRNETQQFHNVEQKSDNIGQRDENIAIAPLITELIAEIRGWRRSRRTDKIIRAVLVAVFAIAIVLSLIAIRETKREVGKLACFAVRLRPPGYSVNSDAIRAKYHCPPFDPSLATPTPTATVTRTAASKPGPTRTVAAPTPTPQPGVTRVVTGPRVTVTATSTRVVLVPGPIRTVTATATRTCAVLICLPGG